MVGLFFLVSVIVLIGAKLIFCCVDGRFIFCDLLRVINQMHNNKVYGQATLTCHLSIVMLERYLATKFKNKIYLPGLATKFLQQKIVAKNKLRIDATLFFQKKFVAPLH